MEEVHIPFFLKNKNMQNSIRSSNLHAISHNKILYDPPPRVMEIKRKINKWDLIKLKTFSQQRKPSARKTTYKRGEHICK